MIQNSTFENYSRRLLGVFFVVSGYRFRHTWVIELFDGEIKSKAREAT